MSVMLSAASCLDWVCQLTGIESVSAMFEEIKHATFAQNPLLFFTLSFW